MCFSGRFFQQEEKNTTNFTVNNVVSWNDSGQNILKMRISFFVQVKKCQVDSKKTNEALKIG